MTISDTLLPIMYPEPELTPTDLSALCGAIRPGTALPVGTASPDPRSSREETRLFNHLASLCARSEYSEGDIMRKLRRWLLDEASQQRVVTRLKAEGFIDDARYCRAYVHDKTVQNGWGPVKIRQALTLKGVCRELIEENLALIGEEQWLASLRAAVATKRRLLGAGEPRAIRHKLLRFAASRGFTSSQALAVVGEEPEA